MKKLHKKFPLLTLDELFDILDCYVEEYHFGISSDPWHWQNYKYTTNGTSTSISTTPDSKISTITAKTDYGTNSTSYGSGDLQLTTSH